MHSENYTDAAQDQGIITLCGGEQLMSSKLGFAEAGLACGEMPEAERCAVLNRRLQQYAAWQEVERHQLPWGRIANHAILTWARAAYLLIQEPRE